MELRKLIWNRLAVDWRPPMLEEISREITLKQLPEHIDLILKGKIRGRVFVNMD